MQYSGLVVYGPRPHPRPHFKALPRWLLWGDLWSKVLESAYYGGPPKFYSSSVMVHCPQNQCYVLASGNCAGFPHSKLLGLLPLSATAEACGSVESWIS
jgi:hypothetical protein